MRHDIRCINGTAETSQCYLVARGARAPHHHSWAPRVVAGRGGPLVRPRPASARHRITRGRRRDRGAKQRVAMRDRPRRQRIAAVTPPNRLTTQRRVAAGWAAMRMGATMMRRGSDQFLPAAMSGMIICMLLLGAILVRSVGLAERNGRVITVIEHSQATTRTTLENGDRVTQDIGLRGSRP